MFNKLGRGAERSSIFAGVGFQFKISNFQSLSSADGKMASGAQLSVLVLTEGLLRENGPDSLSVHSHLLLSLCVKKYVSSIRNNRRALSRNYFSVLASNLVKSYLSEVRGREDEVSYSLF